MFIGMNLQGKRGEFKRQTEDPGDELHVEVLNKEAPARRRERKSEITRRGL
jgi:hypothetical protein